VKVFLDPEGEVVEIKSYPFLFENRGFSPLLDLKDNSYVPESFKRYSAW
jgi:hypothetical protein